MVRGRNVNIDEEVTKLLDLWNRGFRKDVLSDLTAMSSMKSACVSAMMVENFLSTGDGAALFVAAMRGRLT